MVREPGPPGRSGYTSAWERIPSWSKLKRCRFVALQFVIENHKLLLNQENINNLNKVKITKQDVVIACENNELSKVMVYAELYDKREGPTYENVPQEFYKNIAINKNVVLGLFGLIITPNNPQYKNILPNIE